MHDGGHQLEYYQLFATYHWNHPPHHKPVPEGRHVICREPTQGRNHEYTSFSSHCMYVYTCACTS